MVHGWVAENDEERQAIDELTYNQAIDFIISQPGPRADLINKFMNENPSQLTLRGLRMIESELNEMEVAVFFRNNHFSTIIKLLGKVYSLCTDVAFVDVDSVVWECLENIDGNNVFCNSYFLPLEPVQNSLYGSQRVSQNFKDATKHSSIQKFGEKKAGPPKDEIPKPPIKESQVSPEILNLEANHPNHKEPNHKNEEDPSEKEKVSKENEDNPASKIDISKIKNKKSKKNACCLIS